MFYLLFLLFYVICEPVPAEGTNSLNSDFERLFRLYSFKLLFVDFRVISGQRSFIAYVATRESIKHVFSFPLKALSQHDRHVCNTVKPK